MANAIKDVIFKFLALKPLPLAIQSSIQSMLTEYCQLRSTNISRNLDCMCKGMTSHEVGDLLNHTPVNEVKERLLTCRGRRGLHRGRGTGTRKVLAMKEDHKGKPREIKGIKGKSWIKIEGRRRRVNEGI